MAVLKRLRSLLSVVVLSALAVAILGCGSQGDANAPVNNPPGRTVAPNATPPVRKGGKVLGPPMSMQAHPESQAADQTGAKAPK